MKLGVGKDGSSSPIDDSGKVPTVEVLLACRGAAKQGLRVEVLSRPAEDVPTLTVAVPRSWINNAFRRAFSLEGSPIPLGEILSPSSEIAAIVREDLEAGLEPGEIASVEAVLRDGRRRIELAEAAAEGFSRLLGTRIADAIEAALIESIHLAIEAEESSTKLTLPWRGAVGARPKRGGVRGDALAYYLKTRAEQKRTAKTLTDIFGETLSEERARARFYKGQKIYKYLSKRNP